MNNYVIRFSVLALSAFSVAASATAPVRVDAKKVLGLQEGEYKVTKVDKAYDDENVCLLGDVEKVAWYGDAADPVIGMARRTFSGINKGLIPDESPNYSHGCKYSSSVQALDHHFISDDFSTGCDDGNRTVHIEANVHDGLIDYSAEIKISRDGKVVSVSSKCTLQKVDAKP